MFISGNKSVKKGQKKYQKSQKLDLYCIFQKKIVLANLKHINSYNMKKKSTMSLYDFRTYFFPLGQVEVSFSNLLTTANNYRKILSDFFYQKSHLALSAKGLMRVGNF